MQNNHNNNAQQNMRRPGKIYWAILIATITLIVLLTAALVVVLCVGGDKKPNNDDNLPQNTGEVVKKPTKGNTTGIMLPCATPAGIYRPTMGANVATIEGINSECAVLVDNSTGNIVASKDADTVIHPASMTKIMTLLVACENAKDPNALLTVKEEMLTRRTELDGSGELVDNTTVVNGNGDVEKIDIIGMGVTLEDALHLINYQSDTVACLLVAEYVAGSESAFVAMMNKKAADIGLTNTTFVNCTGLTEKDGRHNTTTAREMAAIMSCVLKNTVARKIVSSFEKYKAFIYEMNNGKGKKTDLYIPFFAEWYNRETRLNGNVRAGDVNIQGGKTGFEDIPDSCFVTYGVNQTNGKEYICVTVGRKTGSEAGLLNNATSTADTRAIYKNYAN